MDFIFEDGHLNKTNKNIKINTSLQLRGDWCGVSQEIKYLKCFDKTKEDEIEGEETYIKKEYESFTYSSNFYLK